MTTADTLTQWLQQPAAIPQALQPQLEALIREYPYYVPARYLQAATFLDGALPDQHTLRLYRGNWLLFHQLMERARQQPEPVDTTAPEEDHSLIPDTLDEAVMQSLDIPHISSTVPAPEQDAVQEERPTEEKQAPVFQPIYTEDYFLHQGIQVSDELPGEQEANQDDEDKSLMVVMSFHEWLMYFKTKKEKEKEEQEDKKALKAMWQKEKLAAALEEESEEIPESVFEMAVNSIAKEEGLASESLAEILIKQGKYDKAIDMYQKLSLRNPQKNVYFAAKIDAVIKLKDS